MRYRRLFTYGIALSAIGMCGVVRAATLPTTGGQAVVAKTGSRSMPKPIAGHPGNVFLKGEIVAVKLPDASASWRLVDYDNQEIARVPAGTETAELGALPVGFYRLLRESDADWVSLAVLEPLKAPTPTTSPIGIDVAMAWFYGRDRMTQVASLEALAGVNHVRDRLTWGQMEPQRGRFASDTQYDASAKAQSDAGLSLLQVNHSSPGWANADGRRFPLDLRDAYRFYKAMAARWRGKVEAFEPWNEADGRDFGGHTGAEMAYLQKASYLGLKAGNPHVTACLNVLASHQHSQLEDLAANEAWPYFDTYNLHHYEGFDGYPFLYADHRAVSAGRPLWVTECAIPVKWSGTPERKELSDADLRIQSERIAQVYVGAIHEGAAAAFYFILGDYVEGQTQFGVIRRDLTPRPAYVAVAAAGRLLADAKPLGKLRTASTVYAYAFRARPDGLDRTVVVAWTREGAASLKLPGSLDAVYDHLGRSRQTSDALALTAAPQYAVLPADTARSLSLIPPPARPARLPGKPSPVVLQTLWPESSVLLTQSAYHVSSTTPSECTLYVYNFGPSTVDGTLRATANDGWKVEGLGPVRVESMGRREFKVRFVPGKSVTKTIATVRITGDFGTAGMPVASIRLAPEGNSLSGKPGVALPGAKSADSWELMVSGGPTPHASADGDGLIFEAAPGSGDAWFYPKIKVKGGAIPRNAVGLACTITLLEGDGLLRAIFDEKNGASYVSDFLNKPKPGVPIRTVALFADAAHGDVWSAPDPDGKLDPSELISLKIGFNGNPGKLRYRLSDIRWVSP